jgi:hypothetical protein
VNLDIALLQAFAEEIRDRLAPGESFSPWSYRLSTERCIEIHLTTTDAPTGDTTYDAATILATMLVFRAENGLVAILTPGRAVFDAAVAHNLEARIPAEAFSLF